jgi:hypothetical protein
MIARCPDLAELHVFPTINFYKAFRSGGNPVRPAVNVETIFEDSMGSPTFVPKLKKSTVKGSGFKFGCTTLPYLRARVHLEIEENMDASFWRALATARVRLSHLTADPSSPRLVCYLVSYSGLKDLHFRGLYRNQAVEVPLQVLRRHSLSLQNLSFNRLGSDVWVITVEYPESIPRCRALRTPSVLYHYPDNHLFSMVGLCSTQDVPSNNSALDLVRIYYGSRFTLYLTCLCVLA